MRWLWDAMMRPVPLAMTALQLFITTFATDFVFGINLD